MPTSFELILFVCMRILIDVNILNIQYQEVSSMLLTNFKGVYSGGDKGELPPLELRAITHINSASFFGQKKTIEIKECKRMK